MSNPIPGGPTIEADGWTLVSAEEQHAAHPETFWIPSREARTSLSPGDAAKLLFDIEIREQGRVSDRGVDRMWVIVKSRAGDHYRGILDNAPGRDRTLRLSAGDEILFGAEHVADIERPPRTYVLEKYGADFFEK